jgi:hypothetical protein
VKERKGIRVLFCFAFGERNADIQHEKKKGAVVNGAAVE